MKSYGGYVLIYDSEYGNYDLVETSLMLDRIKKDILKLIKSKKDKKLVRKYFKGIKI